MERTISRYGSLFAEFDDATRARAAYDALVRHGYAHVETFSPYPLTTRQARRPGGWTAQAVTVFAFGALGAVVAYVIQWYTNARSYALDIGGRPAHAVAAFVPVTFETVALASGLCAFVFLLAALRLPRLWRPVFEIEGFERAAIDRYWVSVRLGSGGGDVDATGAELASLGALRVLHVALEE